MPPAIDQETQIMIVVLRALDYSKQEIADQLDLSRHTVSGYLKETQEEITEYSDTRSALINFLQQIDDEQMKLERDLYSQLGASDGEGSELI